MNFLHRCTVILILAGCSSCSPYASKRIPVGNAIYISAPDTAASNKNVSVAQPVLICGPDAPCLAPDQPFMMHDHFNDVPVQKNAEAVPVPQGKSMKVSKTSKEKKKTPQPAALKPKSSTNSTPNPAEVSDKKSPHGVVVSEDLNKTASSMPERFVPLSEIPDKVYTDKQRNEMYNDKEEKQSKANDKAAQLEVTEVNSADIAAENTKPPATAAPPLASGPLPEETENILKRLLGNPDEVPRPSSMQEQKEKTASGQSTGDDVNDANVIDTKIPPEAITNIRD